MSENYCSFICWEQHYIRENLKIESPYLTSHNLQPILDYFEYLERDLDGYDGEEIYEQIFENWCGYFNDEYLEALEVVWRCDGDEFFQQIYDFLVDEEYIEE